MIRRMAVVIIPMFGRLGLLGLLCWPTSKRLFPAGAQTPVAGHAGQAAIAVENAQLYSGIAQEQQRMLAVLQNAADAILMFDYECAA